MPSIQEEGKADIKCKGCSMGCGRRSWCDMRKCNLSIREQEGGAAGGVVVGLGLT